MKEKKKTERCENIVEMESPYGNFPVQCSFTKGHSGEHGCAGKDVLGNSWFIRWKVA